MAPILLFICSVRVRFAEQEWGVTEENAMAVMFQAW